MILYIFKFKCDCLSYQMFNLGICTWIVIKFGDGVLNVIVENINISIIMFKLWCCDLLFMNFYKILYSWSNWLKK